MLKRAISLFLVISSFVLLMTGCDLLSGMGSPGEGWKEFKGHIHVSHRSPKLSLLDKDSTLSHFDSCEVEIGSAVGGSYVGAEGHYVFKNAAIIKTLTIDGQDYTIRVRLSDNGEVRGYTSSIRLNGDTEKGKILSGYIRDSGYEGYYKIEPHTLVEKGTRAPNCTQEGYTEMKCSGCRYVEKINVVPELGHSVGADGACTVCGEEIEKPDDTEKPEDTGSTDNPGTVIGQIGCVHPALLDLDVGENGLGVVTGYFEIKLDHPETISDCEYRSTKEQIIKITSAERNGNVLRFHYLVTGYGEADILVLFESKSLNAERLCEIHVIVADK